jgi:hypothetical protein
MFQYSYLCGANINIFVDSRNLRNIKIKDHILQKINLKEQSLDAAAVHYTLNNSVQPIYSHHAPKFDGIVLGREIVQGSLVLNYKDFTYLYQQINPDIYVKHLLSNKTFGDSKSFSNYVDYNYLPPFNIYIVENGNVEKGNVRVHVLNNCYIGSRGQSIYSDDQNIIEEYSFIAQSYSFGDYFNSKIDTYENTSNDQIQTQEEVKPVENKEAASQTKVGGVSAEGPTNTNGEAPKTESKTEEQNKQEKQTDKSVKIESNAGTASTILQPAPKLAESADSKKSSNLVIQDPKMKNDIRNKDKLLGENPELTYVVVNNILLPKLSHMKEGQEKKKIENIKDQNYSQYIREHVNKVLDFTKDNRDNKIKINSLVNGIEYDIPSKYRTGFGDKNPNLSYFENIYEKFNKPDSLGRPYNFFEIGAKSRQYTTSLSNIYRSNLPETDDYTRRPTVLFDAPTERDGVDINSGLSNEQKINLNQKRMNYANQYKVLASEWNNSNNSYTYKNDFWLSEVLTPTGVKYEYPGRYYRVDDQNKMYIDNVINSTSFIDTSMLWTKKGYFPDVSNYNEGFFDQTMTFLDSFFSKSKIQVDPYHAMYGIMTEETENSTVEERNKSIEKVNELISHINDRYLKTKGSDEELFQSLIALSKQIYYYRSNGEVYSLYDDWDDDWARSNLIGSRSDRWSIDPDAY